MVAPNTLFAAAKLPVWCPPPNSAFWRSKQAVCQEETGVRGQNSIFSRVFSRRGARKGSLKSCFDACVPHPPARGPSRPAGSLPPSPAPRASRARTSTSHRPAHSAILGGLGALGALGVQSAASHPGPGSSGARIYFFSMLVKFFSTMARHLAPCTRPPPPQARSSFTTCSAIAV